MAGNEVSVSIRNKRLREVFQRSLQESTRALTFEKLAQCYPYVAEHGADGLREAMNQAMRFWESSSTREFEAILEERDVTAKLAALDQLIEEARERKKKGKEKQLFIESLTPEEILQSHLLPINLTEAERLEKRIEETQSMNKKMLKEITEQENEINELFSKINRSLSDLSSASKETEVLPEQEELQKNIKDINGFVSHLTW
ncbi:Nnf1-domain-containing protein [Dipodascopsis uninucleata]